MITFLKISDGKYRAEEAAAAHEDNAHTANRKRNHLGNEKSKKYLLNLQK